MAHHANLPSRKAVRNRLTAAAAGESSWGVTPMQSTMRATAWHSTLRDLRASCATSGCACGRCARSHCSSHTSARGCVGRCWGSEILAYPQPGAGHPGHEQLWRQAHCHTARLRGCRPPTQRSAAPPGRRLAGCRCRFAGSDQARHAGASRQAPCSTAASHGTAPRCAAGCGGRGTPRTPPPSGYRTSRSLSCKTSRGHSVIHGRSQHTSRGRSITTSR